MAIGSAVVLFAVVWFMVLFVVLPLGLTTQGEKGEVVPGTPSSAPHALNLRRKIVIVTIAAVLVWGAICAVIISGVIDLNDIKMFDRIGGEAPNQN